MKAAICLAFVLVPTGCASATRSSLDSIPPPAADLADRITQSRAVEAVIWGMPAVNYDLMLQAMLNKTSAKQNEQCLEGQYRSADAKRTSSAP